MKYRSVKMMRGVMIADENGKFLSTVEVVSLLNDLQQRLAEAEAKLTETEKELFILASDVFFCERCVNAGLLDKAKRIYDGLSGSEGE